MRPKQITPPRPSRPCASEGRHSLTRWLGPASLAALLLPGLGTDASAGTLRTQTINLQLGWNAVFLEVQPTNAHPTNVFRNLPVQTVAWFQRGGLDSQYLRNPGDAPWRSEGWSVWHAPDQTGAIVSDLHSIRGGQAYLLRSTETTTITLTGDAVFNRLEWQPNNCTFTGLPVDDDEGPTFQQFFAGSSAHARLRIYRLENGSWRLVRTPATTRTRAGEAYWIQTDGASLFQGPLRLNLPASGEIDFGSGADSFPLELTGTAQRPPSCTVTVQGSPPALNLIHAAQPPNAIAYVRTNLPTNLPLPKTHITQTLRIEPDRARMTTSPASTLLRVHDGIGTVHWIPVRASR
jgi:hypothetical protein